MRRQLRRQPADLAVRQPVRHRQIGQLRQLVGRQNQMPVLASRRTMPSRLRPRTSSDSRNGLPCVPAISVSSVDGGDLLDGEQQPARELGRRVGAQRPQLHAQVVAAALAPARLHLRQRRPRRDAHPQRHLRFGHRRVFDRVQRGVVREVRVVEDHRQRPPARQPRSASPTLRLTVARSKPGAAPSARSSGSSGDIHPSASAAAGHNVGPELAQQRLAAVRRLFGGQCEATAEQRAQVSVAFTLDRLARAQLDRSRRRGRQLQLLDQRRAHVRLAQPAVRQHRRQARRPLAEAGARRDPSSRSISSSRPNSGAFERARRSARRRPAAAAAPRSARRRRSRRRAARAAGRPPPRSGTSTAGLRLDLLEQARERGADVALAAVRLCARRDRRQVHDRRCGRPCARSANRPAGSRARRGSRWSSRRTARRRRRDPLPRGGRPPTRAPC